MKKKLEYFWMYYRLPFLMIAGVAILLFYFVYAAWNEKEPAFTAYLFDAHMDIGQDAAEEEFARYAGIDTEEGAVTVNASLLLADTTAGSYTMASLAKFYTEIGTGELDACMMLGENFMAYAESDAFLDLRTCLSEEQMEKYEGALVYVDSVPVGVKGNGLAWIRKSQGYAGEDCVFGIPYNSGHVENAVKFLEFLDRDEIIPDLSEAEE